MGEIGSDYNTEAGCGFKGCDHLGRGEWNV